jgi:hypothetical protein
MAYVKGGVKKDLWADMCIATIKTSKKGDVVGMTRNIGLQRVINNY